MIPSWLSKVIWKVLVFEICSTDPFPKPEGHIVVNDKLIGGFNPSEKYESQLGLFFPIYGEKCSKPPTG